MANELLRGLAKLIDAEENQTACQMYKYCHDFLTPHAFSECLENKNVCPKHEMVKNQILLEILQTLHSIDEGICGLDLDISCDTDDD